MSINVRLREERNRLNFIQMDAAKAAGVSFTAYQNYERGDRTPNAETLQRLHEAGFDVLYIVTGVRNGAALSNEDSSLLARINQLDDKARRAWLASAQSFVESYTNS
ncbi:helix-turn-helix domain-containing protein [Chromobacterium sinusclupearum]|uniref:helix-turn-helix domain-containing protein n=1 Tax=Chromobacterium sinusclupearum TaxID=2077146 RepID=UPI001304FFFF|nr:helix-turn-helix transcriptional regulator [Chromobacterium sinusclupearum]